MVLVGNHAYDYASLAQWYSEHQTNPTTRQRIDWSTVKRLKRRLMRWTMLKNRMGLWNNRF